MTPKISRLTTISASFLESIGIRSILCLHKRPNPAFRKGKASTHPAFMILKPLRQFLKNKNTFYFIAAAGFLFKYWLVIGEEIEPFYRPADDLNYVLMAKSWYWWAEYNAWTLLRPPVWPLFLALVNVSEIPLKIVQELLLCGSTFFVLNRFRKNGINAALAGITFILIIHNPGWLLLANRTLREGFYACLILILIGQLIPLANKRLVAIRWYQLLPTGVTVALIYYTREESILVILFLFAFVVLFWGFKRKLPKKKVVGMQVGWILLGFLGPIMISGLATRTLNYSIHGLFITHEFNDPAFKKVHRNLLRIKPEKPKPFVPLEQESLEKAYEVSPTLATIKEALSGRVGPRWIVATNHMSRDTGEIGGGLFVFALREAAMEEGIHKDALTARQFYEKVGEELSNGFRDGKLEKRFVFSSFIDPELSDYLPRMPASFLRLLKLTFEPLEDTDMRIYYPRHEVFSTLDAYDEVANRRHHLAYRKVAWIRGWAFVDGKQITHIEVHDQNGIILDSTTEIGPRPDVKAAHSDKIVPLNTGFSITLPKADYTDWNVNVVFYTSDGKSMFLRANRLLKTGPEVHINDDNEVLAITVDELKTGKGDFKVQDSIQEWLWRYHGKFHLFLGISAIGLLIMRYALFKPHARQRHFYRWILFILTIIGGRMLLLTISDASSWIIEIRSIFPALVFIPLLFALIFQEALAGFKTNRLRW
ncbi:MAG: hypothetical protein CMI18_06305 [Opitutaceae bacterium]|nr:hypothetical protein [Opitutaceae bacterium]